MSGLCEGKVVLITGAGRGIGRGYALEFARQGATVVVNDLGVEVDASDVRAPVAQGVVDEIEAMGGKAAVNTDDASEWTGAESMIRQAVESYGRLDVLVNNAGILRDRMLFKMSIDDWDAVMKVHLRGTFCSTRIAAAHWRALSKAGEDVDGRILNTTSTSGIFGNPGQSNYGAAKAGIAAFTIIAAMELGQYGIAVNAICPGARTRMTENLPGIPPAPESAWDPLGAENIAPVVVWLASPEARGISGRVFEIAGGRLGIAEGWRHGPAETRDGRWDPTEVGPAVTRLLEKAAPPDTPIPAD